MSSTILAVSNNTLSNPLVTVARNITADDITIVRTEPSTNPRFATSGLNFGLVATINTDVLLNTINAVDPKIMEQGYIPHSNNNPLTRIVNKFEDGAPVSTQFRNVYFERKFSTQGVRANKQQEKLDTELAQAKIDAEALYNDAVEALLAEIQESFELMVNEYRQAFTNAVRGLTVKGNFPTKYLEKNLTEQENALIDENQAEADALEIQIKKLQEQRNAALAANRSIKRNRVEKGLDESFCEEGRAILNEISKEAYENEPSFFNSFS
ncbi:hypothetical protein VCHA53O466_320037 [Vibrio chagasii]|nr:hypothetical protein VCHA53O466_320037 [Vibrio chagasii]